MRPSLNYSLDLDEGLRILRRKRSLLSIRDSAQLCADAHEFLRAGDSVQAEKLYRWAIKVSELLEDPKQEAFCSYDLGELLENAEKYPDAIGFYRKSLPYYLRINDFREVCRLYFRIYYCHEKRRLFDDAIKTLAEARELLGKGGLEMTAVINFCPKMAELYERLGKYTEARQLEKVIRVAEKRFRSFQRAVPLIERATAESRSGRVSVALALMGDARPIITEYADRLDQATYYLNLGGMLSDAARYDEATDVLRKAAGVYDETGNADGLAKASKNLGSNYEDRGFYQSAMEEYRIARKVLEESGAFDVLGRTLNDLGVLHKNLNLHMDALAHYTLALEVFQRSAGEGDLRNVKGNFETLFSKIRLRLSEKLAEEIQALVAREAFTEVAKRLEAGNIPWELGSPLNSEKLPQAQEERFAAAILRGANQLLEMAKRYLAQGEIEHAVEEMWGAATSFQAAKDYRKAVELYYEVGSICEDHGRDDNLIRIGHHLGACLAQYGQFTEALDVLVETVAEAEQRDIFPVLWQARLDAAYVHEQLRQRGKAVEQLSSAVEEVAGRALLFKHVRTCEGFLADKTLLFQRLVEYLMDERDHVRAYEIVLKAKSWPFVRFARAIRDAETTGIESQTRQPSTGGGGGGEALSRRRVQSRAVDTEGWISAQEEMQTLAEACEAKWKLPPRIDPDYFSPSGVINSLADDCVLIDFFFTEHRLHVFTLTNQGLEGQTLALSQEAIYQRLLEIGFFYTDRTQRGWAIIPKVQVLLRAWLGESVDAATAARRLAKVCFCPHGILHLLPLTSLLNNSGAQPAPPVKSNLTYISWNIPHGSFLHAEGVRAGKPQESYLGIGIISDLLNTDAEIKGASELFEESKRKLLISRQLGRSAVIDEMQRADIIHFACHGVYRDDFPELSYLDLGEGERLRALDILSRAKINAKLVVLSACWTSVGRVAPSDDVTSLARSFLYVGAEAVLATLWPVPDYQTRNFIIDFFKNWIKGGSPLRVAFARAREIHQNDPIVAAAFVLLEAPRK